MSLAPRGEAVPEEPPVQPGVYVMRVRWDIGPDAMLSPSAFQSAVTGGALTSASKGPRGGLAWAVVSREAWVKWRTLYVARTRARAAGEAARRLGAPPKRRSVAKWKAFLPRAVSQVLRGQT